MHAPNAKPSSRCSIGATTVGIAVTLFVMPIQQPGISSTSLAMAPWHSSDFGAAGCAFAQNALILHEKCERVCVLGPSCHLIVGSTSWSFFVLVPFCSLRLATIGGTVEPFKCKTTEQRIRATVESGKPSDYFDAMHLWKDDLDCVKLHWNKARIAPKQLLKVTIQYNKSAT
jgi:hypothetical protein